MTKSGLVEKAELYPPVRKLDDLNTAGNNGELEEYVDFL